MAVAAALEQPLIHWVETHYRSISYVMLMRLLKQCAVAAGSKLVPHIAVSSQMSFSAREIQSLHLESTEQGLEAFIEVNFLGLQGASSPLPLHYLETIAQDDPEDSPLNDFYNFFNQHWLKLLLQIYEKYRPVLFGNRDQLACLNTRVASLCGLDSQYLPEHLSFAKLLSLSGYLVGGQPNQWQVAQVIQHYFGFQKVAIQPWVTQRVAIPHVAQNGLGCCNHQLGVSAVIGTSMQDRANQFAVVISIDTPYAFLPHTAQYCELIALVRWLRQTAAAFVVQLCCTHIRPVILKAEGECYLGWTTVLGDKTENFTVSLPLVI